MTKRNVINGAVEYIPRKTKEGNPITVRVPLNDKAKAILERYKDHDKLLPFISEQKYNDAIKKAFKIAEINRIVTILDPLTSEEVKKPLYEVVSSHMARRTFIGNIYKRVKDPNLVSALSGHKDERFFIKVKSQDQGYEYTSVMTNIKRAGFFFPFPVPPDSILCAMKISALLNRQKGRDFYDAMFLLGQTEPDYGYLTDKWGIHNKEELKTALIEVTEKINLETKSKDFEHLLFSRSKKSTVLRFKEFVETL